MTYGDILKKHQERENYDKAAVMFFLAGAEKDGLILQGHSATDALAAAGRLFGINPEGLAIIRGSLA